MPRRTNATLIIPVVSICAFSVLIAVAINNLPREKGTLSDRARHLSYMGQAEMADALFRESLAKEGVRLETLIGHIDNLAMMRHPDRIATALKDQGIARPVAPDDVRKYIARLSEHDRTIATYWYDKQLGDAEPDSAAVKSLADRTRPPRWANHLLARAAFEDDNEEEAAVRFEREGLSFPEEAENDLRHAFEIWHRAEAWDLLRERARDPRYSAVTGPSFQLELALHDRDWPSVFLWLWPASFDGVTRWPLILAAAAAVLWFAIAGRMGRIGEGVPGRRLLYITAFALGVLSIYPTLVFIVLEEEFIGLKMTGQPIQDAIYFVFGVGLREELAKFLLFLPLLPVLNKRGSRIEALTCGALVGLGFAAEENIGYFRELAAAAAIGRFLTANFLHMALTSMVAVAAFDASALRRNPTGDLNSAFIFAIAIHGAYDFFLASSFAEDYSFVAMALFVIISQRFLRELLFAAPSEHRHSLLQLFVVSLAILTGLSYVYASTLIGLWGAVSLVMMGVVGVAILIYMFVRELGAT